jgi:hypothetical protein
VVWTLVREGTRGVGDLAQESAGIRGNGLLHTVCGPLSRVPLEVGHAAGRQETQIASSISFAGDPPMG